MIYKYPYTDFHELNLDYILKLCRESIGLELRVVGNNLKLINAAGETISDVVISYATTAKEDINGNDLTAYLFSANTSDSKLLLTTGEGVVTELTIPYAEKASKDVQGNDIQTYIKNVQVAGQNVVITLGNGASYNLTVPYAEESAYAEEADHAEEADEATHAQRADRATADASGNILSASYAARLIVNDQQIRLEALDGTQLSQITVPFATLAENANKSIENVTISGNNVIFTTHDGVQTTLTIPYALKAAQDVDGNLLTETYIASVQNNTSTGEITFYAADGSIIAQLTPTVQSAVTDAYGNNLGEYIKNVVAAADSDYVVFTRGNGDTISIKIDYSTRAWKDTNNNIISNTYIAFANFVRDDVTNEPWMVFYNGETAELFRIQIQALSAMKDGAGNVITGTYGSSISFDNDTRILTMTSPDGNIVSTVEIPGVDLSQVGGSLAVETSGQSPKTKLIAADGTTVLSAIVPPYAEKALNDYFGNNIANSYAARIAWNNSLRALYLYSKSNQTLSSASIDIGLRYITTYSANIQPYMWSSSSHIATITLTGISGSDSYRAAAILRPREVKNPADTDILDEIAVIKHANISVAGYSDGYLYLYAENIPKSTITFNIDIYY